jgi:hypothetical protein
MFFVTFLKQQKECQCIIVNFINSLRQPSVALWIFFVLYHYVNLKSKYMYTHSVSICMGTWRFKKKKSDWWLVSFWRHTLSRCCNSHAYIECLFSGDALDGTVADFSARLTANLAAHGDLDLRKRSLTLLTWLTKAMVVRGHKASTELTAKVTARKWKWLFYYGNVVDKHC